MKKKIKIQLARTRGGGYYFRLKATNGRTLAHSEIYNSRQACLKTANVIAKGTWVIDA